MLLAFFINYFTRRRQFTKVKVQRQ